MGFMTYFIGLAISGLVALLLRSLARKGIHRWQPNERVWWQCMTSAVLRALPFAFAFAPALLMKQGLGVLLTASFVLIIELPGLLFHGQSFDSNDRKNFSAAASSFLIVWLLASVILFVRRASQSDKNGVISNLK